MIYLAGKDTSSSDASSLRLRPGRPPRQSSRSHHLFLIGLWLLGHRSHHDSQWPFDGLFDQTLSASPLQKEVDELIAIVGEEPRPNADTKNSAKASPKPKPCSMSAIWLSPSKREKYETLLDEMEQGLIAIDSEGKIQLVNQAAATLFLRRENAI
jgi:PAS domain-containing protein